MTKGNSLGKKHLNKLLWKGSVSWHDMFKTSVFFSLSVPPQEGPLLRPLQRPNLPVFCLFWAWKGSRRCSTWSVRQAMPNKKKLGGTKKHPTKKNWGKISKKISKKSRKQDIQSHRNFQNTTRWKMSRCPGHPSLLGWRIAPTWLRFLEWWLSGLQQLP